MAARTQRSVRRQNPYMLRDFDGNGFPVQGFGLYINPVTGRACERTKQTHPYSYERFLVWGALGAHVGDNGAYTDRMYQWDSVKFDRLVKKHFKNAVGQGWSGITESEATNFLREYVGDPELKAARLTEECNVSSGYPVWYVSWHSGKDTLAKGEAESQARKAQHEILGFEHVLVEEPDNQSARTKIEELKQTVATAQAEAQRLQGVIDKKFEKLFAGAQHANQSDGTQE